MLNCLKVGQAAYHAVCGMGEQLTAQGAACQIDTLVNPSRICKHNE
jgi:hypothetical protein